MLDILKSYEWLITYLVAETDKKQNDLTNGGASRFVARNDSQVYKASVLSKAFAEYLAIKYYWKRIHERGDVPNDSINALEMLGILFGLWSLDKHLVYFYEGNYTIDSTMVKLNKDAILYTCTVLKPDVVTIIDSLSPPDYVVNSVLARADGNVSIQEIIIKAKNSEI